MRCVAGEETVAYLRFHGLSLVLLNNELSPMICQIA